MRHAIIPLIVAAVLALAGCADKRHSAQLARAEALLESAPDSALVVLDSIPAAEVEAAETPARYFNLQGIEVSNPKVGDIYIEWQGHNARKRRL